MVSVLVCCARARVCVCVCVCVCVYERARARASICALAMYNYAYVHTLALSFMTLLSGFFVVVVLFGLIKPPDFCLCFDNTLTCTSSGSRRREGRSWQTRTTRGSRKCFLISFPPYGCFHVAPSCSHCLVVLTLPSRVHIVQLFPPLPGRVHVALLFPHCLVVFTSPCCSHIA